MREQDQRTHEEIKSLFTWANDNHFWRSNILSPSKLRTKWDQLSIRKNSNGNGNGRQTQADINAAGNEVVL
ncbi:MAG: hypothetical protein ACQ9MH_13155 [Nitrospinales bacterium]